MLSGKQYSAFKYALRFLSSSLSHETSHVNKTAVLRLRKSVRRQKNNNKLYTSSAGWPTLSHYGDKQQSVLLIQTKAEMAYLS